MRGKGQALLPNGLTAKQERVVLLHFEQPDLPLADLYYTVYPDSAMSRANATKEVQRILKLPLVAARLRGLQEALLAKRERDIDEVDQRQFDIATVPITDGLTDDGDVLPPSQWPERFKGAVESYSVRQVGTLGKDGPLIIEKRIRMHAPTPSAELVYKRRGLIKPPDVKGGDIYNLTRTEVTVIGLLGDSEARRALDLLAERLESQSGSNGG